MKIILFSVLLLTLCFSTKATTLVQSIDWPENILYYLIFDFICLLLMLTMISLFKVLISGGKRSH